MNKKILDKFKNLRRMFVMLNAVHNEEHLYNDEKYPSPSVARAFSVINLIMTRQNDLGISDIAKSLNLQKSSVFSIVNTLKMMDILHQDANSKKFSFGSRWLNLAKETYFYLNIPSTGKPFMEEFYEKTGESIYLGTLRGNKVEVVEKCESNNKMKISVPRGTKLPFYATVLGKVLFSRNIAPQLKKEINKRVFAAGKNGEKAEILKRGFAVDRDEYISGVSAASAIIDTDHDDKSIWILWAVGFSSNMEGDNLIHLGEKIKETADRISKALRKGE